MFRFMGKTQLDPETDRYLVPSLMRGLDVLQLFTPERRELSLGDIATQLGLTRSATFRCVYTLSQMGFLLHDAGAARYRLGPAVLRLGYGYLASRELVEIALPELERLRDETDWSTHLGLRDGRAVLYVLRQPSRMGLSSIVSVGSRLPAAGTTMGRVLLADLDEDSLLHLYREETYARAPGRSPRSTVELLAQWQRDRASETVVQVDSFEMGIASVAAPVRDLSGRVIAAINATTGAAGDQKTDAAERMRGPVLDAAARISRHLGRR